MREIYEKLNKDIQKYLITTKGNLNSNWIKLYKIPKIKILIDKINYLSNLKNLSFTAKIYCIRNFIFNIPICKSQNCNKKVNFYRSSNGFNKYCSRECRRKNVRITNEQKEIISKANKGRRAWNKGLTKKNDKRVANYSKTLSLVKKGKSLSLKQFRHLIVLNTNKEFNKKRKDTLRKNTFLKTLNRLKNSKEFNKKTEILISEKDYRGLNRSYRWKCNSCNKIFESTLNNYKIPLCKICFPINSSYSYTSKYEKEIKLWLENLGIEILSNNRSIIFPYEIDLFLPDYKLGIEFNGLYWHSELQGKDRNYHLKKYQLSSSKGIKLIHIFEDEWLYKKDIVKSIIKSKLNIYTNIYYARKCIVQEISNEIAKEFLKENHIQGEIKSRINIGLFSENKLVSLLCVSKNRFKKNNEWEITRFSNDRNTKTTGAFGKLFKYVLRNYCFKNIRSYCDIRYFDGKVYLNNRFKLSHISKPNYYYTDYIKRYNRIQFQKHKLKNRLEIYDKNLTEWENMRLNNYDRIWDCGNKVFIYE